LCKCRSVLQTPFTIVGQHPTAAERPGRFGELAALRKDVGMFRLITICTAVVLVCALVGGYLANDNVAQSIVEAVPSKSEHVLSTSDGKVETTDEATEDIGDTADDVETGEDDSGDDGDVANAAPADDESGGEQPPSDAWNPGDAPGEPGK
jgi:hypothetical protein